MSLRTIQSPSIALATKDIDVRVRKLESYFTGAPIPSARIKRVIVGGSANSSGEVFVRDEDNNDIVILNKDGVKVRDEDNNDIVILNKDGISVVGYGAINEFIKFTYSNGVKIAVFDFAYATSGIYSISELINKVVARTESNRITYWTASIDTSAGDRDVFMQISSVYNANVFTSASFNFSKDNTPSAFSVIIDNSNGSGYMDIPDRASDPAANGRRMYFNSSSNRFRFYDTAWRTLTPAVGLTGDTEVTTPYGTETWTFVNGCLTNIV